jgi:carboxylate-amine ligase
MNRVRAWMPHLLALAASSPFHAGEDTGFASIRTMMWRRYPLSGAPPSFTSEAEHSEFMDMLLRSGIIPDERTVYWSVRPSPRYPTLELRVCDVCPSITDAVAIAVLARALVVAAAENRLPQPPQTIPDALQDVLLRENEWLAARDGLDAELVAYDRPTAQTPIREGIHELLEIVAPIAASLGDTGALAGIAGILAHGNAAQRLREQYDRHRDLATVMRWAVEETRAGSGMDRRATRRDDRLGGYSMVV